MARDKEIQKVYIRNLSKLFGKET